jgi:acyl-CoA reductase-like NAD-dependent aldehyde dehydrogenase
MTEVLSPTQQIPTQKKSIDAHQLIEAQRRFFNSGKTKSLDFRVSQLQKLYDVVLKFEKPLEKALYDDLRKPEMEAWATEVGVTLAEIKSTISDVKKWVKPEKVKTPLFFLPGSSWLYPEPYGVCLIISPWNYPFKNLMGPLIGCISAGNTAILKPSELSPATSAIIKKIITETFPAEYLTVVEGAADETQQLLEERFGYIMFTGGTEIGRIIYQKAAKHLTPVTLELGGKSPCIVDKDTDLDVTVKRIAWGKYLNAGQICIAPDYILVHKDVKAEFVSKVKATITEFFGNNPKDSKDFGRIVSNKHFHRIKNLIDGDVVAGGETDESQKYIAPTIINNVKLTDKVMQEEIFGPIMPIIEWQNADEIIKIINTGSKPLALYVFTKNYDLKERIINETSSGSVVINDVILHAGHGYLPFGGVGNSGIGAYNGKIGFETFSHKKPVLKRSFLGDVKQKYAPYDAGKLNFIKFAIRRFL